ncbi:MAG TPA: FAD-binding oxidoreductase [Blastocatellia bacterium]|nr:FAD-binding oxidoreductase [Blastocatellia bacterium]
MTSSGIARTIESIVGTDHVDRSSGLVIDGHTPATIVRPGSREEVAECLRVCTEANLSVVPAGLMSWLECGNPLRRADVVLCLERLNRIIEYSPADLTVEVEAGLTIKELYVATEAERQWLPLDPPGAARASLGAIASCASSGPLRAGFGTPRDYVIGLRLAHADGSESKSGGRVVKNVAGYDMNKLYIGSFGTLAVITELTFKLRPLPDSSLTVMTRSGELGALAGAARHILLSDLLPVSLMIYRRRDNSRTDSESGLWTLAIRFIENEAAVTYQASRIGEILESNPQDLIANGSEEMAFWEETAEIHRAGSVSINISLPLSEILSFSVEVVSTLPECAAAIDVATGIIRVAFDANERQAVEIIKRLRAEVAAAGGSLVIEKAATIVRREADAWGDIGPAASIMRAIKEKLDPGSILNPGRFVCDI